MRNTERASIRATADHDHPEESQSIPRLSEVLTGATSGANDSREVPAGGPKSRRAPTNLSDFKIRSLKPGAYVQGDTQVPGFGVRMRPSGAAAYIVMKRLPGATTPRRITLGRVGEITLEEAREKARQAVAALRQGVDINLEKRRERDSTSRRHEQAKRVQIATGYAAGTFGAIAMDYIDSECARLARGAEIEATIRRELLPALGTRPFAALRRGDLRNIVNAIIKRGRPAAAHKVREIGKRIASWAADDEELIDHNPFVGGKSPVRLVSRDRVLSTGEIAALWRACETMGRPFGAMIMLLLTTLQRRGEVSGMENAELDLERRLWTIPGRRTKNRKEHLVPLSSLAVEILAGLSIIDERNVFSTRPGTRVSGFSKAKRLADELSGVAGWRLHDLRRTATTAMAELKVDRRVISKTLNHTPRGVIGVTAIYDRYEYLDERAAAMELWAQRLRDIVNPPPANIVQLRAGAAA
jgi:integrase